MSKRSWIATFGCAAVIGSTPALAEDINYCRANIDRADALDFPSRHAWNLFVTLMHPAKDPQLARGEPDCSQPIGAPGTTSVWETWRLARTEVFLPDGSEPPAWNDLSLPSGFQGRVPEERAQGMEPFHTADAGIKPFFDPETDNSVLEGRGGIGETRMNKATYEFIKEHCLYSKDGLTRYAKAFLAGKKPPIVFSVDSVEVKAVWLEFDDDALERGDQERYYNIEHEGNTYGLTSFHILTKDIPNWFWATFHHVDAPENEFELPDTYGRPPYLSGTVWENYVLGGAQIDFVTSIGEPTILSDHYIEFGFQRSSCITCHAMASGSPDGPDDPDTPRQTIDVGVPTPELFKKDGESFYLQTDFVWSIPFRAKAEAGPPPDYCLWE